MTVEVIGTAGHSTDEVSYRINDMIFIGDAIPVKGDIPIFIDLEKTKNTIRILEECFASKEYQEIMNKRIESVDVRALIAED